MKDLRTRAFARASLVTLAMAAMVLLTGVGAAAAETLQPSVPTTSTWIANGRVKTSSPGPDGSLYIGGEFSAVGPYTGGAARLSTDDATLLSTPDVAPNEEVACTVADGEGGYYIGGTFTLIGTVPRAHIAHILADGTLDPEFDAGDVGASVRTMALDGDTLYIGGWFQEIEGESRDGFAAVDSATGALKSWSPECPGGSPGAMVVNDGFLFVGGTFSQLDGHPAELLAKFDLSTGELIPGAVPEMEGAFVSCIAVRGDNVFAGGYFSTADGERRTHVVMFDADDGALRPWDPIFSNGVYEIDASTDRLYVGGWFTEVDGDPGYSRLAAFDLSGNEPTPIPWNPGIDGTVYGIMATADRVYAAGVFNNAGGDPREYVAAWDIDGSTYTLAEWDPAPFYDGYDIVSLRAGEVLLIGRFSCGRSQRRAAGVAQLDSEGVGTPWAAGLELTGGCDDLYRSGDAVFTAGNWTDDADGAHVMRLDAQTGAVEAVRTGTDSRATAVIADGNHVYYAVFGNLYRASRTDLTIDPEFSCRLDEVYELAQTDDTIYIGGMFSSVNDEPRSSLAEVTKATGELTAWDSGCYFGSSWDSPVVNALLIKGERIYVGGRYQYVGGGGGAKTARGNLAAFDRGSGSVVPDFLPEANGQVRALDDNGSDILVGGMFDRVGGQDVAFLGSVDQYGIGTWSGESPQPQWVPETLLASGGQLFGAGGWDGVRVPGDGAWVSRANCASWQLAPPDAPSAVSDLTPSAGDEPDEISLSWINPDEPGFAGVRILRSVTGVALSPEVAGDQTLVYEGDAETFVDTGRSPDVLYIYSVFARSENGAWSDRAVAVYAIGGGTGRLVTMVACSTSPDELAYGGTATIVGRMKVEGGQPKLGAVLELWASPDGSSWSKLRNGTEVGAGRYTASVKLTSNTYFAWRFSGDETCTPCVSSGVSLVEVRAALGRPWVSPATPRAGRWFALSGSIAPRHTASTTVRLKIWRRTRGRWVLYRNPLVTLPAGSTRYRCSIRLPAGTWKVSASHSDASHASSSGASLQFRVRK